MHQTRKLVKHQYMLHCLAVLKARSRTQILKNMNNELLQTVCECAFNVLRGVPQLSAGEKEALKPYKKDCRELANKSKLLKFKRRLLLKKKGRLLPKLLKPVLKWLSQEK